MLLTCMPVTGLAAEVQRHEVGLLVIQSGCDALARIHGGTRGVREIHAHLIRFSPTCQESPPADTMGA